MEGKTWNIPQKHILKQQPTWYNIILLLWIYANFLILYN